MNKKGFDTSQLFIYIVAVAVVGFVLLFGVSQLISLQSKATQIERIDYMNSFKDAVIDLSTDHQSVRAFRAKWPDVSKACFINLDLDSEGCPGEMPLEVCDLWDKIKTDDSFVKSNIFLIDDDEIVGQDHAPKMIFAASESFICANIGDTLLLEGFRGESIIKKKETT